MSQASATSTPSGVSELRARLVGRSAELGILQQAGESSRAENASACFAVSPYNFIPIAPAP